MSEPKKRDENIGAVVVTILLVAIAVAVALVCWKAINNLWIWAT